MAVFNIDPVRNLRFRLRGREADLTIRRRIRRSSGPLRSGGFEPDTDPAIWGMVQADNRHPAAFRRDTFNIQHHRTSARWPLS